MIIWLLNELLLCKSRFSWKSFAKKFQNIFISKFTENLLPRNWLNSVELFHRSLLIKNCVFHCITFYTGAALWSISDSIQCCKQNVQWYYSIMVSTNLFTKQRRVFSDSLDYLFTYRIFNDISKKTENENLTNCKQSHIICWNILRSLDKWEKSMEILSKRKIIKNNILSISYKCKRQY